jgi:hypothetical protein
MIDEKNLTIEWCSNCGNEQEIPKDRISKCPECGEKITPCNECPQNYSDCKNCPFEKNE